jgi:hypothetical protein
MGALTLQFVTSRDPESWAIRTFQRGGCSHVHVARDCRAPVRHDEDARGRNSLPDEDASQGRRRDGVVRPHLQSDARLEHVGVPAVLEARRRAVAGSDGYKSTAWAWFWPAWNF